MNILNFVMALSPIVVVLVGILAFHQSAKRVAPIALVWTLVLAFIYVCRRNDGRRDVCTDAY